jgi:2-polyprenyl-3-methyl-5-hydroxy-6-metoxy-1,4-benzoquinol methylase
MHKDGFSMFKCPNCELVYINPAPQQNFLNEKVYSFESGYQANKQKDLSKIPIDKKTKEIMSFLVKSGVKGKLLDVGCSNGEFLFQAKKNGFESYGVELNRRTADIANSNGLNVFNGLLSDAKFEDNFFDVIFMGDLIEHVLSPDDLLLECKRILKKNGLLIISTPNLDCLWARTTLLLYKLFRIPWSSVTPPFHTFQFSEKNLNTLLDKRGFQNISTWFYKPPRLLYEIGSLHLVKRYKRDKKILTLFYMLFSFSLYVILYFLVVSTRFLRRTDFSMVSVYKN